MRRMLDRLTQLDRLGLMALCCFAIAVSPFTPWILPNLAGIVLCFVVVGAIWAIALLPRGVGFVGTVIAAAAFTFASGIVGGFLLHYLPDGLTQTSWLVYALVVAAAGYVVARVRRVDELFCTDEARPATPSLATTMKVAGAAAAILLAVVVSVSSTDAKNRTFTELWLVPDNPLNSPVRAVGATLGIKSHEASDEKFTIVFDSGGNVITSRLTLAPQQVWTKPVYIEGDEARALLYLGDDTASTPYRTVWVARR